jgi:hypothetical protein
MHRALAMKWRALVLVVLSATTARAEGYNARPFRLALDPRGIGTIDGAHAPERGTATLAVGSDYLHGPLLLTGSSGTEALLRGRWVLEPALSVGLSSGFALFARAPFAVADSAIDRDGALTPAGPFPPVLGGLVPLYRDPFTGSRLSLRAEMGLPIGDPASFRGDRTLTARPSLVYGGKLLGAFAVVSAGAWFGPTREAVGGTSVTAGVGARFPADGALAASFSLDGRVEQSGRAHAALGGGIDVRIEGGSLRLMVGLQHHPGPDLLNPWAGIAWVQDLAVVRNSDQLVRERGKALTP